MDISNLQVNLKQTGERTTVPKNDIACLMYYLKCCVKSCGIDSIKDRFLDYQNYHRLSRDEENAVLILAVKFSPDELIGKVIFEDTDGSLCASLTNTFFEISAVQNVLAVRSHVIVGGQLTSVQKIMVYKRKWLEGYYLGPIRRNTDRLARIVTALSSKHCEHCNGEPGRCACDHCPRQSYSQCTRSSLTDMLARLLLAEMERSSQHCDHCPGKEGLCVCEYGCQRGATKCTVVHKTVTCNKCRSFPIKGPRYRCRTCHNFDLCASCYQTNVHATHAFDLIERRGAAPYILSPRKRIVKPEVKTQPKTQPKKPSHSSTRHANPAFRTQAEVRKMPILSMKAYLRNNEVSFDGVFEKEHLRRLVWETQIDCMSVAELSCFLQECKISTQGCNTISARREKAKEAFRAVSAPVAPTREFKCGQRVRLINLKRVDMNDKTATVLADNHGAERVNVQIDGVNKSYMVKSENLVLETDALD